MCVRGVFVCVCEKCVCEVGVDTQQSFAAMLCMGYYKFGGGVGRQPHSLEETTSSFMTFQHGGGW